MAAATTTDTEDKVDEKTTASGAKGSASAGRSRSNSKNKTPAKARKMTDEHKEALAVGRHEGRVVNEYLDALETHKPKRGRKVTVETIAERIRKLDEEVIPSARGKEKLIAIQTRNDYQEQLRSTEDNTVVADLEDAFKKVAKSYAARLGIGYDAFREAGVPSSVLKEAGVTRRSA